MADTVFVAAGRISRVHLADAAIEGATVGAWALVSRRRERPVRALAAAEPTVKLGELPA